MGARSHGCLVGLPLTQWCWLLELSDTVRESLDYNETSPVTRPANTILARFLYDTENAGVSEICPRLKRRRSPANCHPSIRIHQLRTHAGRNVNRVDICTADAPRALLVHGMKTLTWGGELSSRDGWKNVAPRVLPMQHQQRRAKHGVPALTNISNFAENGVPGLFSRKAFNIAWTEYQGLLVDNLNRLVDGQPQMHQLYGCGCQY